MAAARLPVLEPAQIAARLSDSLRLLGDGPRQAEPRHQTMRAAIDWSYALLTPSEQALWRQLSVFRGSFSLTAAEAVCGGDDPAADVLDLLGRLARKSLVAVARETSEARYILLEPMRQYAAEKLALAGEARHLARRHRVYYLAWCEQNEQLLRGPHQADWLGHFDSRYANVRAALADCLHDNQDGQAGLRLATAVWYYWFFRHMFTEGRRWLAEALATPAGQAPAAARQQALFQASALAWFQADFAEARRLAEASHALAVTLGLDGRWGQAYTLMMLGQTVRFHQEEEAALGYLRESLARFRTSSDRWGLALCLDSVGSVCRQLGDLDAAEAALRESQALWHGMGDAWGQALNTLEFFLQSLARGDKEAAEALFEQNRTALERLGYAWHLAGMSLGLAQLSLRRGDYATAARNFAEALTHTRRYGSQAREARALAGLGAALLGQARPAEAEEHTCQALQAFSRLGLPVDAADCLEQLAEAAARSGLGRAGGALRAAADSPDASIKVQAAFAAAVAEAAHLAEAQAAPVAAADSLTRREIEVLRLAAEGLTDPQIAQRLVISTPTVNAHLRAIYGKLGVTTRTAATRRAIEQRLI